MNRKLAQESNAWPTSTMHPGKDGPNHKSPQASGTNSGGGGGLFFLLQSGVQSA